MDDVRLMEEEILNEMMQNQRGISSDAEEILVIDSTLRKISIPAGVTILGVESDDDVHRLRFNMPRTYGEFDLSEFDIRINYANAKNDGDSYVVDDKEASGEYITFTWLVGRKAVAYKGDTQFIVCMKKTDDNGVVQQEFNTTVAKLPVLQGLETTEKVTQKNPDLLEAMLKRIEKIEAFGGGGGNLNIGDGLKIENGKIVVDTAISVEKDNTRPVTSGSVYTVLGNVEALLSAL